MKSAQAYQAKAAEIERLARDLCQPPELRSEFRAIARQWRHRAELAEWNARQLRASHAPFL
jgi:hypothetical protein